MKLNSVAPAITGPLIGIPSVDPGPAPQPTPLPEPQETADYAGLVTPELTARLAAFDVMEARLLAAAANHQEK